MTVVFTSLAFMQLARALASLLFSEPIWRTGLRGNPALIGMLAAALTASSTCPSPRDPRHDRTHRRSPAVGVGLALAILALMETDKALRGQSTPGPPGLA